MIRVVNSEFKSVMETPCLLEIDIQCFRRCVNNTLVFVIPVSPELMVNAGIILEVGKIQASNDAFRGSDTAVTMVSGWGCDRWVHDARPGSRSVSCLPC